MHYFCAFFFYYSAILIIQFTSICSHLLSYVVGARQLFSAASVSGIFPMNSCREVR